MRARVALRWVLNLLDLSALGRGSNALTCLSFAAVGARIVSLPVADLPGRRQAVSGFRSFLTVSADRGWVLWRDRRDGLDVLSSPARRSI